jgi:proteasome accessory factor C
MAENAALRALRLLDIVPYALRNPGITVKELADHFEVSRDELIKDLNLLFMCGLPGYTPLELIDLSYEDGIVEVRDPQNLKSPRNFDESEAIALRIALAALEEQTPRNHKSFGVIQSLRQKIADSFLSDIPENAIDFVADKEEILVNTIKRALEEEKDLEIEYLNPVRDSITVREITPLSLSISERHSTLNSYCHTAQGERSFHLKWIQSVRLIERQSRDLETHNENRDTTTVQLEILRFDREFYLTNQNALLPTLSDSKSTIYELSVYQPEWIIRSTLSEPESVVLLKPEAFRSAVIERCTTALEQYGVVG